MTKIKNISVVDYGCGNMFTINKALSRHGYNVKITDDYKEILNANKIILPGVGAYSVGINNLKKKKLDQALNAFIKKGNYFLGICLGMQLLLTDSLEFGHSQGLDFIKGQVRKLSNEKNKKIPHVGWNSIQLSTFSQNKNNSTKNFLNGIKTNSNFYFVHSFAAYVPNKEVTLAHTLYGKDKFSSISKTCL